MNYSNQLKKIWSTIYAENSDTTTLIEEFFHPDFEQCINGIVMQRPEYTKHVIAQKENMYLEAIEYKYMLEADDELFSIYYPKGKSVSGAPIKAEVIAYFKFKDNKIYSVHGQVRMINGQPSEVDM